MIERDWHMDLRTLTQQVFADPTLTLRNVQAKAIKQHLATIGRIEIKPVEGKAAELIAELTEEQQAYLRTSYQDANGTLELARMVFKNQLLMPSSREVKVVQAYCRKIDPAFRKDEEIVDDVTYQPPITVAALLARLHRYGINAAEDGRSLFAEKLTSQQQKMLEALIGYMKQPVFKVQADKYLKKIDREVFESVFLSTCWNKPDLSAEHILQFIQLAALQVNQNQTDRVVQKLEERLNATLEDPVGRLNMPEVETWNTLLAKSTAAAKQISTLIKALTGERAQLINEKLMGAASLHPLVQSWKQAEDRRKIIALVERTKRGPLVAEVERLTTMDSLKAEIFGLNPHTITH